MITQWNTKKISRFTALLALPLLFFMFSAPPAALADGGEEETNNKVVKKKIKCKKGYILHWSKKRCIKIKKSSNLDQESVFTYGRSLAYAGQYEEAINVLHLAPISDDHRVLNMLGYSSRKSGKIDQAFAYYNASITVNPDYSLVREYLGEAYLQVGNLVQARAQLTEIERICGSRTCDEYGKLALKIINYQS